MSPLHENSYTPTSLFCCRIRANIDNMKVYPPRDLSKSSNPDKKQVSNLQWAPHTRQFDLVDGWMHWCLVGPHLLFPRMTVSWLVRRLESPSRGGLRRLAHVTHQSPRHDPRWKKKKKNDPIHFASKTFDPIHFVYGLAFARHWLLALRPTFSMVWMTCQISHILLKWLRLNRQVFIIGLVAFFGGWLWDFSP